MNTKQTFAMALLVAILTSFQAFSQADQTATLLKSTSSKTVVFITGAFVSHEGWNEWKTYFESKGYTTLAPPWPHKNASAAQLRAEQPLGNPGLASLTFQEVVDYYADILKKCPEKPIVIGHSLGGLLAQIMVNKDLAAAGVAIHPAPPKGVLPYEFGFIRGGGKVLGLGTSLKKTYLMSFKKWQYAFVNGMPLDAQQAAYDANTIPESKRVARGALGKAGKIDFKKQHAPLLITSGDVDHIIPAHLNRRNFKRYKQNGSITEYKEFPGRNHYVLGLPTWKEDADYILNWLGNQQQVTSSDVAGK